MIRRVLAGSRYETMKNNDYDHGCLRKANIRDFCFFPGIALIILGRENGGFALEINQKIWYSVRVCKRKKETVQSNVFCPIGWCWRGVHKIHSFDTKDCAQKRGKTIW